MRRKSNKLNIPKIRIGLQHEVTRLNPQNLISNCSDKKMTDEEIDTLSHGLTILAGFLLSKNFSLNSKIATY